MRLIDVTAPSLQAAMAVSRERYGDDAILVSTREGDGEHVITIAIEQADTPPPVSAKEKKSSLSIEEIEESCYEILSGHGVPAMLIEEILEKVRNFPAGDVETSLCEALREVFSFNPLGSFSAKHVVMAVGPAGAGKTQVLAKMIARAMIKDNQRVAVISTDTQRAGGLASLLAFANVLSFEVRQASSPKVLVRMIDELLANHDAVLVDAGACNYLDVKDLAYLGEFIKPSKVEPLLILPAGLDVQESWEQAKSFRAMGTKRMIITRIDGVRRLGSFLQPKDKGGLAMAEFSDTPNIKDGLIPAGAQSLTKLLLSKHHATKPNVPE
ncbi:MAG: hypothetical protein AAF442_00755 [Pseudomonadota bacterium]